MKTHITKDGKEFLVRKPGGEDAEKIIQYSRLLFASTDQVLNTPEEYTITPEAEKDWIDTLNGTSNALLLIAERGHHVIGFLFFLPQTKKKNAHVGEFGVNVHPDYQALGIGRALIESLITWADDDSSIEKITLQVFATNSHAIKLYASLGFKEEGRYLGAIKQSSGQYIDILQLYRWTKNAPSFTASDK